MTDAPHNVQRAMDEGYEFRLGDYISNGFTLVQLDLGSFIGYGLLYGLISAVGQVIPLVGPLIIAIIGPALAIGMLNYAHLLKRNEPRSFNDFFAGFSQFGELFLVALLSGLLIIAAAIPGALLMLFTGVFNLEYGEEPNIALLLIGFLVALVPIVYLSVSFSLAPQLVWFHGMGSWYAIVTSRQLVDKQWGMWFIFYLVTGFIAAAGLILLCVGILFTMPAMACSRYDAFADITRLNEEETQTEDDLIDHFGPLKY